MMTSSQILFCPECLRFGSDFSFAIDIFEIDVPYFFFFDDFLLNLSSKLALWVPVPLEAGVPIEFLLGLCWKPCTEELNAAVVSDHCYCCCSGVHVSFQKYDSLPPGYEYSRPKDEHGASNDVRKTRMYRKDM